MSKAQTEIQQNGAESDERYLIQDTRQVCGNCILWWGPDSRGYTCDVDKAGRYSLERATNIEKIRGTDVKWKESVVLKNIVRHVRADLEIKS